MAMMHSVATDPARQPARPGPSPLPAPAPSLATFLEGRPAEERLVDLLAYALAVEQDRPANAESVARLRQEAASALAGFAIRHLHNRVEEIRQQAVAERLAQLRRPPGLLKLVFANLLALCLGGAAAYWLATHPDTLAGLAGLILG